MNDKKKIAKIRELLDSNNFFGIGQSLHRSLIAQDVFDGPLTIQKVEAIINKELEPLQTVANEEM